MESVYFALNLLQYFDIFSFFLQSPCPHGSLIKKKNLLKILKNLKREKSLNHFNKYT